MKLPYLDSHQMIASQSGKPKRHTLVQPSFDLRTNHASIPRYSAPDDRNMAYFFDKPSNRKMLEQLHAQEDAKKHSKR